MGAGRRLQSIVLDFDGVMADTEPLHLRAFQQTLERHGVVLGRADYYERYLGYDDGGVFEALARDRGLDWSAGDIARLVHEKAGCINASLRSTPVLFDGVRDAVLGWVREVPVGIASGALREEIEIILRGANLLQAFPVVVAAGETPSGKPAPDPYEFALAQLGAEPGRSVAVEDSAWGVESAHRAGMKVIALTTSYPRERLIAADLVVPRLTDLTLAIFEEVAAGR